MGSELAPEKTSVLRKALYVMIGIAPWLLAWFTLHKSFSNRMRLISFAWMIVFIAIVGQGKKEQKVVGPAFDRATVTYREACETFVTKLGVMRTQGGATPSCIDGSFKAPIDGSMVDAMFVDLISPPARVDFWGNPRSLGFTYNPDVAAHAFSDDFIPVYELAVTSMTLRDHPKIDQIRDMFGEARSGAVVVHKCFGASEAGVEILTGTVYFSIEVNKCRAQ